MAMCMTTTSCFCHCCPLLDELHWQNYAVQYAALASLGTTDIYPRPAAAIAAASALGVAPNSIDALIKTAEETGNRDYWTYNAPPNMLFYPDGQSYGAVADIMAVTHDKTINTIAMTLDVVHKPRTISEFDDHADQVLDESAHYHFYTPPGVEVSATKVLSMLPAHTPGKPAAPWTLSGGSEPNPAASIQLVNSKLQCMQSAFRARFLSGAHLCL